jgi:hypothetical protein
MRRFPMLVALIVVSGARTSAAWAQDSTVHAASMTDSSAGMRAPAADTKASKKKEKVSDADKLRLTSEEIDASKLPNGYELVDRLRRPWLRKDALTGAPVSVYMDEQNIGGAEKLRDIPAADIAELQFLPNEQAVRRWGATAVPGSVIVVVRRR